MLYTAVSRTSQSVREVVLPGYVLQFKLKNSYTSLQFTVVRCTVTQVSTVVRVAVATKITSIFFYNYII